MHDDVPRKSQRATRKGRERRDKILEVASEVFREHGFEATSMSQIAALAGGSKGTLYNYFPSKEDLLLATLVKGAQEFAEEVLIELDENGDTRTELGRFLPPMLRKLYSKETAQLLRVVVSVGGNSDIGRRFFNMLDDQIWDSVTRFLAGQVERGMLRSLDPKLMSDHLHCLCDGEIITLLMGAMDPWDEERVQRETKHIIDMFLRVYQIDRG
ncbi:MAG TPA: TetR/AcrR family transcriptional regulator [Alcaligenes sp.]|nr:TetR/AcrR family transcriptional regulator [Alcaligenes sp.]HRL26817.1 TetR/AcrR family transcriptional regulator [Alcaligenes sp.]